jgi:hypothetical protein
MMIAVWVSHALIQRNHQVHPVWDSVVLLIILEEIIFIAVSAGVCES